jgi:hypothetical protein
MANPIDLIDVETRSVKLLTDMLKDDTLTIDESFQRRYVWVSRNKVSLIETILLGYPIPEIYLWQNETDPESGETKYSIVDGQQRLGAIEAFINNDFRLNQSGLEFKDADYARKLFNQLTSDQKSSIWKYKFSIRFLKEEVSREEIVKIFLRLNSTNTSLNPQELRNAEFNGEFIKLAEKITELGFWEDYKVFNAGDLRRMLDIQFVSTLLIFLRMGIEEETTQLSINKVYDLYNEEYLAADEDYETFVKGINIIHVIAQHSKYTKEIIKKKTHLYALFVLAYYLLKTNAVVTEVMKDSLGEWFEHYLDETSFEIEEKDSLLNEYKALSLEGVQKKANRQRRFEILKEITL